MPKTAKEYRQEEVEKMKKDRFGDYILFGAIVLSLLIWGSLIVWGIKFLVTHFFV